MIRFKLIDDNGVIYTMTVVLKKEHFVNNS
jgi:hypothetical protein